jgi:hypothetical protein
LSPRISIKATNDGTLTSFHTAGFLEVYNRTRDAGNADEEEEGDEEEEEEEDDQEEEGGDDDEEDDEEEEEEDAPAHVSKKPKH